MKKPVCCVIIQLSYILRPFYNQAFRQVISELENLMKGADAIEGVLRDAKIIYHLFAINN